MKRVIIYGLIFGFFSTVVSAQNASIRGKVLTSEGSPAEFVNVTLSGTTKAATVDKNGRYEIRNIKSGHYTVRASFVGFVSQEKTVDLGSNDATMIDFQLSENSNELKEVVVNANPSKYVIDYPSISLRLKSPLIEVPQNIQVVSRQTIQDQQIFDMLEGVTRNVSGATRVEHWDNYAQINMRGSQISAFRNGMNVQSTWGPLTEDMSMVERIEFVKGPAGFMLANGEPSGFYNVVTKKPTGITKGEANLTLGSFGTYRTTLDFDGKLQKEGKILYRLNIMGQMKGSHRDYEYNNRFAIAPVLKFQLSPNTSLTTEYTYQFNQTSPLGSNYAFSARGMGDLPVNFTTMEPNMAPTNIHDNSLFATLVHSISDNWKFTGQLAYMNFNQEGQTLWPTGFSSNGDTIRRAASNWDILGVTKVGQFFVNGDVKTGKIEHRILAGLDMGNKDYYHDWSQGGAINGTQWFDIYHPVYGKVSGATLPKYDRTLDIRERGVHYTNNYTALYAQDEIRLFQDKLRITLAGRYTSADNSDPYSGAVKASRFTPRAGLSYSFNKNTSLYAVVDEAFVPQAGSDYNGKGFDPVTGGNKEIGLKREWLDGLWTASVSAYQITKNNVLTSDPNHQYFSIQLGQTRTQGVEFDIRGQVLKGLDITMNYAYTDGKITKDTDPNQVGSQIPGTSKHVANGWLNYRFTDQFAKGFGVSFGVQYSGKRSNWYAAYDHNTQQMPDYTKCDGALSYQNKKYSIALNVNNLFNTYLYSGAYYTYGNFYYWQAEALRNFRLSMNYKF